MVSKKIFLTRTSEPNPLADIGVQWASELSSFVYLVLVLGNAAPKKCFFGATKHAVSREYPKSEVNPAFLAK